MKQTFLQQYRLLQNCRNVVFDFLEAEISDDLNTPVSTYASQSPCDLMQHVAACYISWLGYFALKVPAEAFDSSENDSIQNLRKLYKSVDELVYNFIEQYDDQMNITIEGIHDAAGAVQATPAQLFTHVFTHEFHHKGQLMNMCRCLGHTPPDTDVSLFFTFDGA